MTPGVELVPEPIGVGPAPKSAEELTTQPQHPCNTKSAHRKQGERSESTAATEACNKNPNPKPCNPYRHRPLDHVL